MYSQMGHRKRLRERFREEGLDHFDEASVLEFLLFYAKPRVDTKELARELLNRFGSLSRVLEATHAELETVEGVGENTSTLLTLIPQLGRYYLVKRSGNPKILDSTKKYGKFLVDNFHGRRDESVFLLCLDAKCKVICCKEISEGSVNAASISIRKVVETALNVNATSVVLAHNHPSGNLKPSPDDLVLTADLKKVLGHLGIKLIDHIIVTHSDVMSFAGELPQGYSGIRDQGNGIFNETEISDMQ